MRGKAAQRGKESKSPTLSNLRSPQVIINHSLRTYSHENLAWLRIIDKILQKPRNLLAEIGSRQSGEWLQRYFKPADSRKELLELAQYYKYYKCTPLVAGERHFEFMNAYWSRSKTIYYMRIKRILQIDQDDPEQTLQKNITHEDNSKTDDNKSTFYLMPQLQAHHPIPNDNTLEKILSSLQRKGTEMRGRTIKDIDKAYKFHRDQSKTKDRHSQQKSHLKTNPSNLISQFSCKPVTKKKKQNHKSLSNEPHSQERLSRGKKLATASSCMNIAHDSHLNYLRRDKHLKNSQKELKNKKREASQICLNDPRPHRNHNESKSRQLHEAKGSHCWNEGAKGSYCWNEGKGSHKKAISNERSSEGGIKSKSGKKRLQTQSNVKAAIDKTKNKIKMEKSMMLKKYVESRQSYTKSIDSTCGEVGKHGRK